MGTTSPSYPTTSVALYSVRSQHSFDTIIRLDEDAFVRLYEAYYAELLRYASRLLGDETHAQDAVQEAFLRLWKRKNELDTGRYTRALLYKAVRNLCLNTLRNDRRRQSILTMLHRSEPPQDPETATSTELLRERVRIWIAELPERRREAFELSRFEGLSYSEIASLMEISTKTVENHIILALRYVRDKMDSYDPKMLRRS